MILVNGRDYASLRLVGLNPSLMVLSPDLPAIVDNPFSIQGPKAPFEFNAAQLERVREYAQSIYEWRRDIAGD